ncbi:MAG: MFS transporter [Verrucomicrobiales bacterium]|nr:MFS transporter [Verrucomicrobiales bacterium]
MVCVKWYEPTDSLSDEEVEKGLKVFSWESLSSHSMTLLVTGAFLPGMALAIGAGNFMIGLLASFAPIAQMAQIPAIFVVEKVQLRKLLTVVFGIGSRLCLVAAALVPFCAPEGSEVFLFTLFMILFFLGGSFAGCSMASLIKDLLPENRRGSIIASRLSLATAMGAVLSISAGYGLKGLTSLLDSESSAYSVIFLVAACFGLVGSCAVIWIPEPRMPKREEKNWLRTLIAPVRDPNFRKLLIFSASWSFTVIMSCAFFVVYMLERIGIPMSTIILIAVVSQVTNIYFFRVWGRIADRFSNKSVLAVTVPLFIVLLLLWPFTTLPERHNFTIPLLLLIHLIGGISTAGFNLCAANIALKLAPPGNATAYLGANAFCAGASAAIAPIVGGMIASYFALKEVSLDFLFRANIEIPEEAFSMPALSFRGIDFVFFAAAITGLYAWHRLSLIQEEGTVEESAVRDEVFSSVRNSIFGTAGLSMGLRRMTAFPYEMLRRTGRGVRKVGKKRVKKEIGADPEV